MLKTDRDKEIRNNVTRTITNNGSKFCKIGKIFHSSKILLDLIVIPYPFFVYCNEGFEILYIYINYRSILKHV